MDKLRVKSINSRDLVEQVEKRRSTQKDIVVLLLNRCYHRIKYYHTNGYQECMYEVPPLILGYPLYNQEEVLQRIYEHIERKGYYIRPLTNYTLYISWRPDLVREQKTSRDDLRRITNPGYLGDLPMNRDALNRMELSR